jgi:glycosyltransferase involved in cell wall biosynthesis
MPTRIPSEPPAIVPLPASIPRPLWSVMIPTYNCYQFIREAVESVLIQDPGPEIMQIQVVDDYSTDGDVEALVHEIGKGRVLFFRQENNKGSLRNFETCINLSKGRYVHLLHGDDRVESGFYKEINDLFHNNPEAGAAFTNYLFIDHNGHPLDITNQPLLRSPGIIPDFLYLIAKHQLIQPPAIVVKREVYETLGSFYAAHFGEDWEMWTRIASRYKVAYSPLFRAAYRVGHGIGISHNYLLNGKNISEIKKVIDIIQTYLPREVRKKFKKSASSYYAIYCVKIANGLLLKDKKAAFQQVSGAWKMSRNLLTAFWVVRFYLMHLSRYKQLENKLHYKEKNQTVLRISTPD